MFLDAKKMKNNLSHNESQTSLVCAVIFIHTELSNTNISTFIYVVEQEELLI